MKVLAKKRAGLAAGEKKEKKEKPKEEGAGSGSGSGSGGSGKGNEKDVVILTDDNFEEVVMQSKEPFFIKFYAPWCGHCKKLAPIWIDLATEMKGTIKVAEADCTVHSKVCSRYGVSGYPTIKFFPGGLKDDSLV